jgi:hypothetical protein
MGEPVFRWAAIGSTENRNAINQVTFNKNLYRSRSRAGATAASIAMPHDVSFFICWDRPAIQSWFTDKTSCNLGCPRFVPEARRLAH